jgi:hypothetical protein
VVGPPGQAGATCAAGKVTSRVSIVEGGCLIYIKASTWALPQSQILVAFLCGIICRYSDMHSQALGAGVVMSSAVGRA